MRQAMTNEVIQGDEWAAYSTLGRTIATYRGMAYGRRRLGSRSPDSSRGSHAPPGSGGKPRAGRSGIPRRRERVSFRRQGGGRAGARGIWTGRYARCRPPQPDGCQPQSRAVAEHWKAGCLKSGHVRFGGGADGKGSQDTSLAAYSTRRRAHGKGRQRTSSGAYPTACCVWNGGKAVKPDLSLPKSPLAHQRPDVRRSRGDLTAISSAG